jgi:hypothetical protein
MLMLDRFYTVQGGTRVRLRLARISDRAGIRALLERAGAGTRLEPAALLRFDPRERAVICATALLDGRETIVAIGSIELGSDAPSVLVADARVPGLSELVTDVLTARASAVSDIRAA